MSAIFWCLQDGLNSVDTTEDSHKPKSVVSEQGVWMCSHALLHDGEYVLDSASLTISLLYVFLHKPGW
jgi:hypothetical protein